MSRITQLKQQVAAYKLEENRLPRDLADLVAREYLEEVPLDAWRRPFIYRAPGTRGRPFDIVSLGDDGQEGGEGAAADLWSHPPR